VDVARCGLGGVHAGAAVVNRRTAQELDPIGGITARVLVVAAVCIAVAVAVGMSLSTIDQVSVPWLEGAALLAFAGACVSFVRFTSPFLATFPRSAHAFVCLLALAAVALDALAQWGSNTAVGDDWPPITLAILTITLGFYRPAWEIAAWAVGGAVVIGAIAAAQADSFSAQVPAAVFAILPATPVLAAGLAAASFSRSLVGSLLDWHSAAGPAAASAPGEAQSAEPSKASHLVHLDDEVLPFLERVLRAEAVTEGDGERARLLAGELRSLMVLDSERSWLARLVAGSDDPERYADRMSLAERGFVRALVAHLRASAALDDERMRLSVRGGEWEASCTIEVPCVPGSNPRVQLAPYVAVARSVFGTVAWRIVRGTLTMTLTFDPTSSDGQ
jgi:hypothetical protein